MNARFVTASMLLLGSWGDVSDDGDTSGSTSLNMTSVGSTDSGGPTDGGPDPTVGPGDATDGDTISGGITDDTTAGSTTAPPVQCCSDAECIDESAPFCVDDLWSPCSASADPDGACADMFPETPVCVDSQCVQCSTENPAMCAGVTTICDDATNTCIACTDHTQCPADAACHIANGECFPTDTVYWVDGDNPCPGAGTQADPFCAINPNIPAPSGAFATFHIAELDGGIEYLEPDRLVRQCGG